MRCDICGQTLADDELAKRSAPCRDGQPIELNVCKACEADHPAFREKSDQPVLEREGLV